MAGCPFAGNRHFFPSSAIFSGPLCIRRHPPFFSRPSLLSRRLATPHFRFFVAIWSPFRPPWIFPPGSAWSVLMFLAPIVIGLPFVWAGTFEVTRLSTTPAFCLSCTPSPGRRRLSSPECHSARIVRPGN
jgi:hypothetical protein